MSRVIHLVGKTTHIRESVLQLVQRGLVDRPGQRIVMPVDDTARFTDDEIHQAFPSPHDDVIALSAHPSPRHTALRPGDVLLVAHIAKA